MTKIEVWHPFALLAGLVGLYIQVTFALVCGGLVAGYLSVARPGQSLVIEHSTSGAQSSGSRPAP